MTDWQPSATIDNLKRRHQTMMKIRHFFEEKQILEVDTPVMSQASSTDVHLHSFQTHFIGPEFGQGQLVYLTTSPEFHMKRLLAAGSGSIYQITKAFRNEENGRYHNPEFSMLEWYRVGFDHHDLMQEVDALLQLTLDSLPSIKMTYQEAFLKYLNLCPLSASLEQLKQAATSCGLEDIAKDETNKDILLQLLFSVEVESHIGLEQPTFIYHFPASQAALAKINHGDPRVADRFEVYFQGIELANGFHELDDPKLQLERFEQDNQMRLKMGLKPQPIDYHLIEALKSGLPACAGVAVGIDRLMMLALKEDHIDKVSAFSFPRA